MNIDRTIHCYRITIGGRCLHLTNWQAARWYLAMFGPDVVVDFHRGGGRYEAMEVAA